MLLPSVTHQTCLVQWTWNVLSIRDYPGASNECDPRSSHPSYENPLRWRRIPEEMTTLERVMTAWCLEDITPLRTSQEAEEMKEKWKRKAQITFLAPSVKFRHPMPALRCFEYLICFWSYQACDYTVTKPRTWPTCWSISDRNWLSSHRDIHPTIQTFISLVTMEPAVTHQTRLVQWTWNVLLIWDYPGASNECNPCSSHPSHKNQPSLWRRIHEDGLSWCKKWVRHIIAIHRTRRLSWRE